MRIGIFEQMTVNNGLILTLFILIISLLALGYGFGVKARRLPFTAEIGFNQQQWQFQRSLKVRSQFHNLDIDETFLLPN